MVMGVEPGMATIAMPTISGMSLLAIDLLQIFTNILPDYPLGGKFKLQV